MGDVRRIRTATGRDDFVVLARHPYLEEAGVGDYDYDPLWREYICLPDGRSRLLRTRDDGVCTFLGDDGCLLHHETRPLLCRVYPYSFNEFGLIGPLLLADALCPVPDDLEEGALGAMLPESWESAESARVLLYQELRAELEGRVAASAEQHQQHAESDCGVVG